MPKICWKRCIFSSFFFSPGFVLKIVGSWNLPNIWLKTLFLHYFYICFEYIHIFITLNDKIWFPFVTKFKDWTLKFNFGRYFIYINGKESKKQNDFHQRQQPIIGTLLSKSTSCEHIKQLWQLSCMLYYTQSYILSCRSWINMYPVETLYGIICKHM